MVAERHTEEKKERDQRLMAAIWHTIAASDAVQHFEDDEFAAADFSLLHDTEWSSTKHHN